MLQEGRCYRRAGVTGGQVLQEGRCYRRAGVTGQTHCKDVKNKSTGCIRSETAYAITSLSVHRATPIQLLHAWREHWQIRKLYEGNKLHWVRDVTFDEDPSTVRKGRIPQVMAALRNTAIGLLRVLGATNIAGACRFFAAQPRLALAVLGCLSENE